MVYLLLSIFSSTLIFVIFKLAEKFSCATTLLISVNYVTAFIFGILLFSKPDISTLKHSFSGTTQAIIVGVLFTVMFFLIGQSTQKAGITITTLANKLSLVFPVLFSLFYFNEKIPLVKIAGLTGAFIAIILTLYKSDLRKTNLLFFLLPLTIFFGSGITDSVVKFAQTVKITHEQTGLFTTIVFFVAMITSFVIAVFNKKVRLKWNAPTLFLGLLLGLVNFGSLYFFLNALNKSDLSSALVFSLNNMSVVILSTLTGFFIFKESLNRVNLAGILLALTSLYLMM